MTSQHQKLSATKPIPRRLIYSFQMDAARRLLRDKADSGMSNKLVKRLRKAIEFNSKNPLLPEINEQSSESRQAGRWWTLWPREDRLRIKGTVRADCERVGLFVNDRLVKLVNTVPRPGDPRNRRSFRYNVNVDIMRKLPRKTLLGVGSERGYLRHRSGRLTYKDGRLAGDGTLFNLLTSTHFLTKKGRIQRRLSQNESWKAAALSAYTEFRAYFESTFGHKPFIICGTLLGFYREGDFIDHDDDMDVAYFSHLTSPGEIRKELKAIVSRMLLDGYDIKLALKSGFFKPTINGISFDVFPMWSDRDCLWMMNTTRQQAGPERIIPVQTERFRGVEVYVPHEIGDYIEAEYGPNWRVPDPGYKASGEPGTADYLSGSCIGTEEIVKLHREFTRLASDGQDVGRLSIADRDIDAIAETGCRSRQAEHRE